MTKNIFERPYNPPGRKPSVGELFDELRGLVERHAARVAWGRASNDRRMNRTLGLQAHIAKERRARIRILADMDRELAAMGLSERKRDALGSAIDHDVKMRADDLSTSIVATRAAIMLLQADEPFADVLRLAIAGDLIRTASKLPGGRGEALSALKAKPYPDAPKLREYQERAIDEALKIVMSPGSFLQTIGGGKASGGVVKSDGHYIVGEVPHERYASNGIIFSNRKFDVDP